MQEYDAALKLLLQTSTGSVLRQITGGLTVARWLNVEFSEVRTRRVDLLGETADGQLVHVELQSSNDGEMALRMAEYSFGIYRQFRRFPHQIVLYVGEAPLRMTATLSGPDPAHPAVVFRYTLIDFRHLDGDALLSSSQVEDNILAILTRLQNQAATIRQILKQIGTLEEPARRAAFAQFLIVSGLRRLEPVIQEEAKRMPILNSILDHQVIGPAILQGRQQGLKEGRQEGQQEGRQEIVRRLLEKRFGAVPDWVEARLVNLSASEIDEVAVRLLEATRLEDLFPPESIR